MLESLLSSSLNNDAEKGNYMLYFFFTNYYYMLEFQNTADLFPGIFPPGLGCSSLDHGFSLWYARAVPRRATQDCTGY